MNISDLYNPTIEMGVIASLVQNPNLYFYSEHLSPRNFYNVENGLIYFSVSELIKRGIEKIDAYNILMILNSKRATKDSVANITVEKLNEMISLIWETNIGRSTQEEYLLLVNELLDYSFRRETLAELEVCKKLLFDTDIDDVQSQIYDKIETIIYNYRENDPIIPINKKIDEIWERISSEKKDNDFIDFKFPTLNKFCKLSRTDCIIISALQKRGKSIFLLNCLADLLSKGKKVLYIDSELDTDLFMMRLLAHLCQIDFENIRDRRYRLNKDEYDIILQGKEFIKSKAPYFFHEYVPILTEESVLSLTKQAKHKYGIEVVILDYLKGNSTYALDAFKNSAYLGRMTDLCKNILGGKERLFVLAAVQAASDQQESVADSKKIMRNCSSLLHLSRKTPQEIQNDGGIKFGNMKLVCELNRNGRLHDDGDYISLLLDGDRCTFTETEQPQRKLPF